MWLWWILVFSTLPLHLLLNSVIFTTTPNFNYIGLVVTQDFHQKTSSTCPGDGASSSWDGIACNMYEAASKNNLTVLDPISCIEAYSKPLQSEWSNLFLVSGNYSSQTKKNTSLLLEFQSELLPADTDGWNPTNWLCSQSSDGSCTLDVALKNSSNWQILEDDIQESGQQNGSVIIQFCLAEPGEAACELQYSVLILAVIVLSNAFKLFAIAKMFKVMSKYNLITVGDAVASFLETPDPSTSSVCLMTIREDLEPSYKTRVNTGYQYALDRHLPLQEGGLIYRKVLPKWRYSVSERRVLLILYL